MAGLIEMCRVRAGRAADQHGGVAGAVPGTQTVALPVIHVFAMGSMKDNHVRRGLRRGDHGRADSLTAGADAGRGILRPKANARVNGERP